MNLLLLAPELNMATIALYTSPIQKLSNEILPLVFHQLLIRDKPIHIGSYPIKPTFVEAMIVVVQGVQEIDHFRNNKKFFLFEKDFLRECLLLIKLASDPYNFSSSDPSNRTLNTPSITAESTCDPGQKIARCTRMRIPSEQRVVKSEYFPDRRLRHVSNQHTTGRLALPCHG